MVSPLSKDLIAGAIGESGSPDRRRWRPSRSPKAEKNGAEFADRDRGDRRWRRCAAMPGRRSCSRPTAKPGLPRFAATVDGYFLPKPPVEIFAAGEQAHVPLLVGWNSEEHGRAQRAAGDEPTPRELRRGASSSSTPSGADEVLKAVPGRHRRGGRSRRPPTWRAIASSPTARGSGSTCTARPAASRSTATSTPARGRR